jgi:hypothetical protein
MFDPTMDPFDQVTDVAMSPACQTANSDYQHAIAEQAAAEASIIRDCLHGASVIRRTLLIRKRPRPPHPPHPNLECLHDKTDLATADHDLLNAHNELVNNHCIKSA